MKTDLGTKIKKFSDDRLISIVCVDNHTHMVLQYFFDVKGKIKSFKHFLDKKNPETNSITDFFPVADFFEREIQEFFGVKFKGRDYDKLFLAEDDSVVLPLRRDKKCMI